MCNLTPVKLWLAAVLAAIVATIAIIIGAAIANGSFVEANKSFWGMLAAGVVAFGAVFLCGMASSALNTFCTCAKASPKCAGPCSSLNSVLTAAKVVLGIQATDCLLAAFPALIPIIGQIWMWIIVAALLIQLGLIISAIAFLNQLDSCQNVIPPTPPTPPTGTGPAPKG
jgi:hypothetical protein